MTEATLQLAARYYRALPIDRPRYEQVTLSLPVSKTALVGMHCWNIGYCQMNAGELRDLLDRGWGVGNHSWTHEVIAPEMVDQEIGHTTPLTGFYTLPCVPAPTIRHTP